MRTIPRTTSANRWAPWTREPRNGREFRQWKAGLPEPAKAERPQFKRPYRCRRHGRVAHKVVANGDRMARVCLICRAASRKAYALRHQKELQERHLAWKQGLRSTQPRFENGVAYVTASWLRQHVGHVELKAGQRLVVEVLGTPAYQLVAYEELA